MANAYIIAAKVTISLHNGLKFLNRAEVNHTPGSYVYTMGILRMLTWRTGQLVSSQYTCICYMSATLNSSPAAATICSDPHFNKFQNF